MTAEGLDPRCPGQEEARGFLALYRAMSASSAQRADLWRSRGHRVGFEDVIAVSVSRTWSLDSSTLLDLVPSALPRQLVPVIGSKPDAGVQGARIRSLRGSRTVETAPQEAVQSLIRTADADAAVPAVIRTGDGDTEEVVVAVSLEHDEYVASPEVTVTAMLEGAAPRPLFRFRFLLPVTQVEVHFESKMPLEPFVIDLPELASLDHVALSIDMGWGHILKGIDGLIALARDHRNPSTELTPVDIVQNVDNGILMLRQSVRRMRIAVDEISAEAIRSDGRPLGGMFWEDRRERLREVPLVAPLYFRARWVVRRARGQAPCRRWTRNFRSVEQTLSSYARSASRRPDRVSLDEEIDDLERLRTMIEEHPAAFTAALAISRSGVADTDALASVLRHDGVALPVTVRSLLVPLSTEREPGTQGTRSMMLLATLGFLLLGLATVDLSWLPFDLWGLGARSAPDNPIEALVALLVIFPAALYSQFFQTRPTSSIGHRAQLGTFSGLSLVFALPLVPAVMAGAGAGLDVVSMTCVVVALVALLSAGLVMLVFTRTSLSRLRLGLSYRWDPKPGAEVHP